ncbi:MFS transporter [Actinomadura verrucosospora]|uniref:Major facilitator MFS1 protein n=1 Tax=Actinomadura verrucosospora TaxID=46165 RepID=A0A7D3VU24_ACTVE|nr:MFS transporter [Actinomadura verrucosospora]QKG19856.1 major facilitator MFS1 protein [Actinomadura verrucosospora]
MTPATTPWRAVAVVLTGAFMAILDSFIVIVAGPSIKADLHIGDGPLQWVLAGYQLTYAVLLITGGRLGDLYGRRRVLLFGTGAFTVASVVCAMADGAAALIAARLVQGLGAALMLPQTYAFLTVLVPDRDRHRAFGVLGMVMGLAAVAGQLAGGLLIGSDVLGSGWRSVFWINVPIGLATLGLAARWLPESTAPRARRLDLPGVTVLSAALTLVAFPLIQGRQAGWPGWVWACLAASPPCLAAFAVLERRIAARGGDPLVRIGLFRTRSFSVGLVLVLLLYTVVTSYYLVLSVSLQDGLGLSALGAGLVYTPSAVAFFLFSLLAGRLVPVHGHRVLKAGAIVLTLGYAATAALLLGGAPFTPAVVVPTLVLQSAGGGLVITPSLNTVLSRISPDDAGVASGALSTAQQLGGALGVAVIGAVFFGSFAPASHGRASAAGHALAMASLATCAAAAAATVLVFLLRGPSRAAAPQPERPAEPATAREPGR